MERSEKKLVPTDLGFTVNDLLVKHFDTIFNVGFTADMEEHLDASADGEEAMAPVLGELLRRSLRRSSGSRAYHGEGGGGAGEDRRAVPRLRRRS